MRWFTDSERKILLILGLLLLGGLLIRHLPENLRPDKIPVSHSQEGVAFEKVNVNKATLNDLIAIPGIGPVLADRIIRYRTENGYISTAEELLNVKGVGPASLETITKYIIF
ncbi:MAG: helix-hairpin-helix domain-containing protein [Candidatus Omnitrophica bacterium]|nr:helix-hairpin-helix domain-containing protein [Candidatus Omnitrophota bacterium]